MRPIVLRTRPCIICDKDVPVNSVTSPHPGAPEMLQLEGWMGFVKGGKTIEMVVCCSGKCVQELLKE
jgi:hypothetical protein